MKTLSALLVAATLVFAAPASAQAPPCDKASANVEISAMNGVIQARLNLDAKGCPSYQALADAFVRSFVDVRNSVAIHVAATGAAPVHFADVTAKNFVRMEPALLDANFASFRKREECDPTSVEPKCLYQAGVKALIALKAQPMKTVEKIAGK